MGGKLNSRQQKSKITKFEFQVGKQIDIPPEIFKAEILILSRQKTHV